MEKYAVVTNNEENIKKANDETKCLCGEKLEETNVKKCPKHGTKHFEGK